MVVVRLETPVMKINLRNEMKMAPLLPSIDQRRMQTTRQVQHVTTFGSK